MATGVGWLALEQFAGDTAVPFGWRRFLPAGVALGSVLVAVHAFRARPAAATNLDA